MSLGNSMEETASTATTPAKIADLAAAVPRYLRSLSRGGALLHKARQSLSSLIRPADHDAGGSWQAKVLDRLVAILHMPPNWDGYGAPAVSREAAMFALEVLQRTMQPGTPAPQVVPSSVGGVQLEWHEKDIDLELHIPAPFDCELWFEDHRLGKVVSEKLSSEFDALRSALDELTKR